MMKSVYFFIANTSKAESNKMMAMSFKTFIIKVLFFIFISKIISFPYNFLNIPNTYQRLVIYDMLYFMKHYIEFPQCDDLK